MVYYINFSIGHDISKVLGIGWSAPEGDFVWSNAKISTLRFELPFGWQDCELVIDIMPFISETHKFQVLDVSINGRPVSQTVLKKRGTISFWINADICDHSDQIDVVFYNRLSVRPSKFGNSSDDRELGIALLSAEFRRLPPPSPQLRWLENALDWNEDQLRSITKRRQRDTHEMNRVLREAESSKMRLSFLLNAYLNNVGAFMHIRHQLIDRIRAVVKDLNIPVSSDEPFDVDGRLSSNFVSSHAPSLSRLCLDAADSSAVEEQFVFGPDDNAPYDPNFPLRRAFRSKPDYVSFSIYRVPNAAAFVGPFCYSIIDRNTERCYRQVVSQDLSKSILNAKEYKFSGNVVIVQDRFNCGNIAHFLFDSITRLMHFAEKNPSNICTSCYVLGGVPTDFHRLILNTLAKRFGIPHENFFFPVTEALIIPSEGVFWFSDQVRNLHPAQRMHRRSVELLKSLGADLASDIDSDIKLYVSRDDATHRRISNEAELVEALEKYGFKRIILSQLSYEQQVKIMTSAESIVAPHGMGLTHLALTKGKPVLVELFNENVSSDDYACMAKAYDFRYAAVVGREVDQRSRNYEVNVDEVLEALNRLSRDVRD